MPELSARGIHEPRQPVHVLRAEARDQEIPVNRTPPYLKTCPLCHHQAPPPPAPPADGGGWWSGGDLPNTIFVVAAALWLVALGWTLAKEN